MPAVSEDEEDQIYFVWMFCVSCQTVQDSVFCRIPQLLTRYCCSVYVYFVYMYACTRTVFIIIVAFDYVCNASICVPFHSLSNIHFDECNTLHYMTK